jgi:N-acetylneuraminic acid mutarotase
MKKTTFLSALCCYLFFITVSSNAQWTQKANVGGINRSAAVSFSIGSKGYIGTGMAANLGPGTDDFWEYDPSTNVWTQRANVGGGLRSGAVGFSIGSKGYIGTGNRDAGGFFTDFWEYNPATNTWTQKANFGGGARVYATGFSIGSKGYIGTGQNISNVRLNDFWEYDPATDTWVQRASLSGVARIFAVGFSIGSKGYIGTGENASLVALNDFWQYDPVSNTWASKANFSGGTRSAAVGFSIGSKGYIGTGNTTWPAPFLNDFWEYDPGSNNWTQRANVGGAGRRLATGFSIGGKGYVGTGHVEPCCMSIITVKDFWEFVAPALDPGSLSSTFYCNGLGITVPYSTAGYTFNSGNLFAVQLSNSSGSFSSPVNIGAAYSTATSGTLFGSIPANTPYGTGYRIRVISTNPAVTGSDNGTNLTMSGPFSWYGDIWTSGDQSIMLHTQDQGSMYVCENTSVFFKVNGATSISQYSLDGGTIPSWGFNNYPGYVDFYMPPGSFAVFKVTVTSGSCTYNLFFAFETMNCYMRKRPPYKIAPNPVGSELILYADDEVLKKPTIEKSPDHAIQQVVIMDKFGNELKRQNYPSNTTKAILNVNGLSPDIYVARIFNGKEWTAIKFIKK